jgi:hypothetical protein
MALTWKGADMGEHVGVAAVELCRHPGCGQRWATDLKWEDGWSTLLCDEHWDSSYAAVSWWLTV